MSLRTRWEKMLVMLFCIGIAFGMSAEDIFYDIPLAKLTIISGALSEDSSSGEKQNPASYSRQIWQFQQYMQPYIVGKDNAEMYLSFKRANRWTRVWHPYGQINESINNTRVVVRIPSGKTPSGMVFIPKSDWSGMKKIEFTIDTGNEKQETARKQFYLAKKDHYQSLLDMNIPGAAWFRHEVREAEIALGSKPGEFTGENRRNQRWRRGNELEETYSIFSGGRALSENLQLNRELRITKPTESTVSISSIEGITTTEYDWKKEVAGMKPKRDVLAKYIPFDQYAIFFPSFKAMTGLMDEAELRGTPLLQLFEPRSVDGRTKERYKRQLCLPTSQLSRIFGPKMIASVAMTGSDPYLRTGSDLAVLFKAKDVKMLESAILLRQSSAAAGTPGTKVVNGTISGVKYSGVFLPSREICSYRISLGDVVIVSNSIVQLERLVGTYQKKLSSIDSLSEYIFFRERYKIGNPKEAALMILSDATIRKWCSPRWRIEASRRIRTAAVMAELQAKYLKDMVAGKFEKPIVVKSPLSYTGDFTISNQGVVSARYNTLEFLTPIAEIPLEKVTKQEANAYKWFRDHYQQSWRQYFDPIALRFSISGKMTGADLTVRPLIAESEYETFIEVTGKTYLGPRSGYLHKDSLFTYIISLDPESKPVKSAANFAMQMVPKLGNNGLNWIGNWLTIYTDKNPFWDDAKKAAESGQKKLEKFMEKNVYRLPLAIQIEVNNSMKLALFLTGLRAFVNQTAPGLTIWESLNYNDKPYVKISQKQQRGRMMGELQQLSIYYAATPERFIITLNERMLKEALDRIPGDKENDKPKQQLSVPWKDKNMAVQVKHGALEAVRIFYHNSLYYTMCRRSWSNIMILNEWKRRFKQMDPVKFHQHYWQVKLIDPAHGKYVWNEEYQTMESSVFGCSAQPKISSKIPDPLSDIKQADLGVIFENDGLRASINIQRIDDKKARVK